MRIFEVLGFGASYIRDLTVVGTSPAASTYKGGYWDQWRTNMSPVLILLNDELDIRICDAVTKHGRFCFHRNQIPLVGKKPSSSQKCWKIFFESRRVIVLAGMLIAAWIILWSPSQVAIIWNTVSVIRLLETPNVKPHWGNTPLLRCLGVCSNKYDLSKVISD